MALAAIVDASSMVALFGGAGNLKGHAWDFSRYLLAIGRASEIL